MSKLTETWRNLSIPRDIKRNHTKTVDIRQRQTKFDKTRLTPANLDPQKSKSKIYNSKNTTDTEMTSLKTVTLGLYWYMAGQS